jgi:thiaminase
MIRSKLFIAIALCFNSSISLASVSGNLMRIASQHPGHRELETHLFIRALHSGNFYREQIEQFLEDRIYLLRKLEAKVFPDRLLAPPHQEHPHFKADSALFFRSRSYEIEQSTLLGIRRYFQTQAHPSQAAEGYAAYLDQCTRDTAAIHLWLFLVGDTFGAQSMSSSIREHFHLFGKALTDFDGQSLAHVRKIYNDWITEVLTEMVTEDHQWEQEPNASAFDPSAALETPKSSFCDRIFMPSLSFFLDMKRHISD